MDGPQEVASGFVVARSNGPVLLQACEEVLDQMPSLVEVSVIFARLFVRYPGRNDHCFALVQERLDQPGLGIVGLVGNDSLRGCVLEQDIGSLEIMGLPWREKKACRVAQRIDRGMDLGAQAASAAPEGLLVRIPLLHQRCAGGHARWWRRSWRIRCPRLVLRLQTPVARHRSCSSASDGCARRESRRNGQADPAKEYLHGSGTTRRPRTVDCLLQWLRAGLPGLQAGDRCAPTGSQAVRIF